MYRTLFLLAVFASRFAFSQNAITDSLDIVIDASASKEELIDNLVKASEQTLFNNLHKSYRYAHEAKEIANNLNSPEFLFLANFQLSKVFLEMDSVKHAYSLTQKILEDNNNKKPEKIAKTQRLLCKILIRVHDYENAAINIFESLKIFEDEKITNELSNSYLTVGYLYYQLYRYEESLHYYQKALHYGLQMNNQKDISLALNNIASVSMTMQDSDKAERYYHKSIEINQKINHTNLLAVNYLNLGMISSERKEYSLAHQYFNKSNELYSLSNNKNGILNCKLNIAELFIAESKKDSVLHILHDVLAQCDTIDLDIMVRTYGMLSKFYCCQNLTDSFQVYTIEYYEAKEKLNLERYGAEVKNTELRYQFQQNKETQKLIEKQKSLVRIIWILILITGLVIIVAAYLRLKKIIKATVNAKKALDLELEQKNKELMTKVLVTLQNNDTLDSIIKEISEIKSKAIKPETKAALDQVAKKINETLSSNVWNEFETRFTQVNDHFYNNLQNRFPDLSNNERRMCAFLKLDMNTKEISLLTGQSIVAIEKARIRLRKKLGISNSSISLSAFFSQV